MKGEKNLIERERERKRPIGRGETKINDKEDVRRENVRELVFQKKYLENNL